MSATDAIRTRRAGGGRGPWAALGRLLRCRRASAAINFGFVAPVLVALSLGTVEFTLVMFDFHRASEATRRAARQASMMEPIGSLDGLAAGTPIVCETAGGTVDCGAAELLATETFTAMLDEMQEILPAIQPENLRVTYTLSGIGDPATPGGVLPLVTVELVGLQHPFMVLQAVPGTDAGLTYPPFATTYLAGGKKTT